MKSKIKYTNDVRNSKLRQEVYELISESFQNNNVKRIFGNNYYYGMLLYAKYIIEKEKMDYSKIIDGDIDELLGFLKERFKKLFPLPIVSNFKDAKLYELLKKIAFEDYEIPAYSDRFLDAYLDKNKKYLLVSSYKIPYIVYDNVDIYDADMYERQQFMYEILDEITGNKRNYYTDYKQFDMNNYDMVIYLNDGAKNVDYRDKVLLKHRAPANFLMVCWYSYISNFKGIFGSIDEVFLDSNKAYVRFNRSLGREEDKVRIREISNISDYEIKNFINSDNEKNTVVISYEDFINHGRRIGFSTYKKDNGHEKLLRLIDYNKMITNKIDSLNEEIASQIDRLFVK